MYKKPEYVGCLHVLGGGTPGPLTQYTSLSCPGLPAVLLSVSCQDPETMYGFPFSIFPSVKN